MQKQIFHIILIILFTIVSCVKPPEKKLTMLDVFPRQQNTDSTFVFSLDTIVDFEQISKVFCENYKNNKVRCFIRTEKSDINFHVNSSILCNGAVCGRIKFQNTIFIDGEADAIFSHSDKMCFLNSVEFEKLLEKQFSNNGKNPDFADKPTKNIIFLNITSDKKLKEFNLEKKLDTISKSYFNFLKSFKKQNVDSLRRLYPLTIRLEEVVLIENEAITPPPILIEVIE